jgi:Tfp pilus assembly protein PilN
MIRINLLPIEMRRGNRLPPKVLAAAFGAALAVSGAVGWLGVCWFGDLPAAENRLQQAVGNLASRAKKVAYADALESNKKDYAGRVQAIQDIGRSRRVWSRFLDDLIDVVNNDGDTESHLAWFDSIVVRGDTKKGATVTLQCSLQGAEQDRLANFHDDLEAAPFGKEVTRSDPTWRREEDPSRIPPSSMRFQMTLQFAPTETAAAKKPGAKAAPAK